MPSQLARFTDRCVDLSQNAVIGEPAPAIDPDDRVPDEAVGLVPSVGSDSGCDPVDTPFSAE